jgi:hypothetical protein
LVGIVPSRRADLEQTVAGYQLSRIPLVAFDGERFVQAGFSDDPGLYYFVPALARLLHKNLDESITVFYLSILGLSYALGSIGFILVLSGWPSRVLAAVWFLIVAFLVYKIGDLYLVEFALPAVLVPWSLWWVCGSAKKYRVGFVAFLFAAGALIATAQFIRLTAGPPSIAFIVILLLLCLRTNRIWKILALSVLLAGFLLARAYFDHVLIQRDGFLASQSRGFQIGSSRHTFWHFAYMGLGFLRNDYVQGSCDDFNKEIVRSIAPAAAYLSPEYDRILRQETLSIVRHHPMLAILTVAAKFGIVVAVGLVFANVGLLFIRRRPRPLQVALWAALVFSAVPVLIVVPLKLYLVGVISYSTMFGIIATMRLTACADAPPSEVYRNPASA